MKYLKVLTVTAILSLLICACAGQEAQKSVYEKSMDKAEEVATMDTNRVNELNEQLENIDKQ